MSRVELRAAVPAGRRPAAIAVTLLVALLVALAAPTLRAAEVTISPSADAFVSAAEPTYNYGGAGGVEVSAPSTPNGQFRGLLRFNLAGAKATLDAQFGVGQWKLDAVSLRLTTSNPNNSLFNPNAAGQFAATWMQNDGWTEGTGAPITPGTDGVTYATLPSFLGPSDESVGTLNFAGGTSGSSTYALTLTPLFKSDLSAGGDVSLLISAAGAGGSASYLFASRTFSNASGRPVLSLSASAVPEPGVGFSFVVFAAALLRRPRNPRPSHRQDGASQE